MVTRKDIAIHAILPHWLSPIRLVEKKQICSGIQKKELAQNSQPWVSAGNHASSLAALTFDTPTPAIPKRAIHIPRHAGHSQNITQGNTPPSKPGYRTPNFILRLPKSGYRTPDLHAHPSPGAGVSNPRLHRSWGIEPQTSSSTSRSRGIEPQTSSSTSRSRGIEPQTSILNPLKSGYRTPDLHPQPPEVGVSNPKLHPPSMTGIRGIEPQTPSKSGYRTPNFILNPIPGSQGIEPQTPPKSGY